MTVYIILTVITGAIAASLGYTIFSQGKTNTLLREHIMQTEKHINMVNSGVVGMGNRILDLERKLTKLNHTQKTVNESHADYAYSQARELIAQGLSQEAVSESTGLSLSEVKLMGLVHKSQKKTQHASVTEAV